MAMGTVDRVVPGCMTGGTVTAAGKGLASRAADASTVDIVTAAAGVVNLGISGINQWRWITVTGATAGAGRAGAADCDQRVVTRDTAAVSQRPAAFMTGRTVATNGEGLAGGTADPDTIDIVTAAAGIVNLRIAVINQQRWITVTVTAGGRRHLNQAVMARRARRVGDLPAAGVTGGTGAAGGKVFTIRNANQGTAGIVTATAGIVNLRITGIDQWQRIVVTDTTLSPAYGHQWRMVRGIGTRVQNIPGIGMTGRTVATTDRNTRQQPR